MKGLIIGCGAGRTGTSTLAALLNMQPESEVTHERFGHSLKWNAGLPQARRVMGDFVRFAGNGLYGDVAVQWGSTAEFFLNEGAKVIVTKRDLQSWLASWHRKSGRRDNWRPEEEGGTPGRSRWYDAFPKFRGCSSKEDALVAYYRYYYDELTGVLLDKWPERVKICDVEAFNSEPAQRDLLTFCGVEPDQQVLEIGIRRNVSKPKED